MIQSPSGDADQSWEGGIFPHPLKGTLSKTGRVYPGFGVRILGCLFLAVHYWESYSASLNVIVITCDQGLIKALHRGLWEGLTTSVAFMITVIQALCSRGTRGRIPALTELPSESSCLYTDSPCSPPSQEKPRSSTQVAFWVPSWVWLQFRGRSGPHQAWQPPQHGCDLSLHHYLWMLTMTLKSRSILSTKTMSSIC